MNFGPRNALAKSAAPESISARATIKVLTASGYKVVAEGGNGFVCIVMRGWRAAAFTPAPLRDLVYYSKLRAPICFNPVASKTVLHLQELRARLGMEGKTPAYRFDKRDTCLGTRTPTRFGGPLALYSGIRLIMMICILESWRAVWA